MYKLYVNYNCIRWCVMLHSWEEAGSLRLNSPFRYSTAATGSFLCAALLPVMLLKREQYKNKKSSSQVSNLLYPTRSLIYSPNFPCYYISVTTLHQSKIFLLFSPSQNEIKYYYSNSVNFISQFYYHD